MYALNMQSSWTIKCKGTGWFASSSVHSSGYPPGPTRHLQRSRVVYRYCAVPNVVHWRAAFCVLEHIGDGRLPLGLLFRGAQ